MPLDFYCGLYDADGQHVGGTLPPLLGENFVAQISARPCGKMLGRQADGGLDLRFIWVLPPGPHPGPISDDIVGPVVAALDDGGAVAIHSTHQSAADAAVAVVMPFVGGGRA
jgi:hypothetical protein